MKNLREQIVSFIIGSPKLSLLISVLVMLLSLPGFKGLQEDFTARVWYNPKAPLLLEFNQFEADFGNDDYLTIFMHNKQGIFNKKSLTIITQLTEDLWNIPGIMRVDSLSNYDYIKPEDDDIIIEPLFDKNFISLATAEDLKKLKIKTLAERETKNYLLSEDGTTAIFHAQLLPAFGKKVAYDLITENARQLIKKYSNTKTNYYALGSSTLTHIFKEVSIRDMIVLLPLLYGLFSLILYFIYRRIAGIILPYTVVTPSIIVMMSTLGFQGYTINTLTVIAPTILLTVALADAIHILTSFFLKFNQGEDTKVALTYSLIKNFWPTLLTSLTTAVGFYSFTSSVIPPLAQLGMIVGHGIIIAWFFTYFFMAPLILIKKLKKKNSKSILNMTANEDLSLKITSFISRNKGKIVLSSLIILISLGLTSLKNTVDMDPFKQFYDSHPLNIANHFAKSKIKSHSPVELVINSGKEYGINDPSFLNKVEAYSNWLVSRDSITKTLSTLDIIKNVNKNLNGGDERFFSTPQTKEAIAQELLFYSMGLPEGRSINNRMTLNQQKLRLTIFWNLQSSKECLKEIETISTKAKDFGLNIVVTGKMPLFHKLTPYIVDTFFKSFITAFILITFILIIVLRSLKLGLLTLIPNLFPLIVGGGLFYFTGFSIDMGTVLVASVCLGISVDDSIHFLFEFHTHKHDKTNFDNIALIFKNTAPALFFTTLILIIGFGSFIFAQYIPNAKFGLMISFILGVALIADFLILPALLFFLKDENNQH
ncbi:MAG: MMPL family transporter [Halobacteriovoraceae bacterium]|jgi:uncharacterized protein|nr:MMPL family transporter [Halobacteriovoraceae bacterium]